MWKKVLYGLLLVSLGLAGFYYVSYTSQSIERLPEREIIERVEILNGNTLEIVNEAEFDEILEELGKTRKTFQSSVNDHPSTEDYTRIEIIVEDGYTHTFYFYEEGNRFVVEVPYEGIYRIPSDSPVIREKLL